MITGHGCIVHEPPGDRSYGLNRVDVRDIAECAVNAFKKPGHEGRVYPVHGPDALTGEDIAGTCGRHLGREVR
jgi:uncharacterized protein YbjT (DUF2867 family)